MIKKLTWAFTVFACVSVAQTADSAVITQTGYASSPVDYPSFFDGFDSRLGTLTSVDINVDWSLHTSTGIPVSYPGTNSWQPMLSLGTGPFFDDDATLSITGAGYISPYAGTPQAPVDAHATGSAHYDGPHAFVFFTANPQIYDLTSFFPAPLGSTSPIPSSEPTKVDVAYTFTPTSAVPEPGTWLMMAIGVGFVGSSARKRLHRHVRAASRMTVQSAASKSLVSAG